MQSLIVAGMVGLLLGSLIGWLWGRYRAGAVQERADALTSRVSELEGQITAADNELSSARTALNQSAGRYAQADTQRQAADDRLLELQIRHKDEQNRSRTEIDTLRTLLTDRQQQLNDRTQQSTRAETRLVASEERLQELQTRFNDLQNRASADTDMLRTELGNAQREVNSHKTASQIAGGRFGDIETELSTARSNLTAIETDLSQRLAELRVLTATNATLQADLRAASERLAEQRDWIAAQSANLKTAFSDLAGVVVAQKTEAFKSESQESLRLLLAPLRDQLTAFQTRMDQIHTEDAEGRAGLQQIMQSMGRTHQTLADQARSLSEALTHKPKLQGDFGEMKLEAQLEAGGFKEGYHYLRQPTYRNELDQSKRPDVVIRMPTRTGYLAVDSKVNSGRVDARCHSVFGRRAQHLRGRDHTLLAGPNR